MITPNSLRYLAPDPAEALAERVRGAPPTIWRHKLRAAWWCDAVRHEATGDIPASVILRAAALVAERFERQPG